MHGNARFLHRHAGHGARAAGDREYMYSLTLPQLWESRWEPPARRDAASRVRACARAAQRRMARAGSGGARGMLAEWILFGRFRRSRALVHLSASSPSVSRLARRRRADDFRPSMAASSVLRRSSGWPGNGGTPHAASGLLLKAARWRPSCWPSPSRAHGLRIPSSASPCWRTLPPAFRRRICSANRRGHRLEKARGRHWTQVIPFARATRDATLAERTRGSWQSALHRRRRRPRHQSGSRHARRRRPRCRPAWCRACC